MTGNTIYGYQFTAAFFKATTVKDYFSQFKKPNYSNLKDQTTAVKNLQTKNTSNGTTQSISLVDDNETKDEDKTMKDVVESVEPAKHEDVEMKEVSPEATTQDNKPLKRRKKTPSPKRSDSNKMVTDSPAIRNFEKLSVNPPDVCDPPTIVNSMVNISNGNDNGEYKRSDSSDSKSPTNSNGNSNHNHSNGVSNGNHNDVATTNPDSKANSQTAPSNPISASLSSSSSTSSPKSKPKATGRKRKLNEISKDDEAPTEEPPKKKKKWYPGMTRTDEPPMRGQIEVPTGKPFCLSRKKFVITGTLRSLLREECKDLIMEYGGKYVILILRIATISSLC